MTQAANCVLPQLDIHKSRMQLEQLRGVVPTSVWVNVLITSVLIAWAMRGGTLSLTTQV